MIGRRKTGLHLGMSRLYEYRGRRVTTYFTITPDNRRINLGHNLKEAKRKHVPAFHIMPDRVLRGIVAARPGVEDDLLDISGIGPKLAEKYGKKILELVTGAK